MKNGLLIADSGPLFSMALIDKLHILDHLFDGVKIPGAVWEEITFDNTKPDFIKLTGYLKNKIHQIEGVNELTFLMDYGESEAIVLYKELKADFLLIDDKKARKIAENTGIRCIGLIGLLAVAKQKMLIDKLKPLFEKFLKNIRYYAIELLNEVLKDSGEEPIKYIDLKP